MKQFLSLALVIALFLAACTKTVTNTETVTITVHDTTTVTVKDTLIVKDTLWSNFDYITRTTWMYSRYFSGYVDSSHLGTLQYQRGASGNLINLDNDFDTFNADGTITELDNGTTLNGTWGFTNFQQTTYFTQVGGGKNYGTIVKADKNHFYWHYLGSDGQVKYGELIPKQ